MRISDWSSDVCSSDLRLRPYRNKLFALSIDPERMHQIRQERRPDSRYAKLETCKREVAAAEALFRAERIPVLSTTPTSIEEIADTVLTTLGIQSGLFSGPAAAYAPAVPASRSEERRVGTAGDRPSRSRWTTI